MKSESTACVAKIQSCRRAKLSLTRFLRSVAVNTHLFAAYTWTRACVLALAIAGGATIYNYAQAQSDADALAAQVIKIKDFEIQLAEHRAKKKEFLEKLRAFVEADYTDHARFSETFLIQVKPHLIPGSLNLDPTFVSDEKWPIARGTWQRLSQLSPLAAYMNLDIKFLYGTRPIPLHGNPNDECILPSEFLGVFSSEGWSYADVRIHRPHRVNTERRFQYQVGVGEGRLHAQHNIDGCVEFVSFFVK